MNQDKRNLLLVYPGMSPGLALFMTYVDEGRGQSGLQEPVKDVREDGAKRTFRFVRNLMRRPRAVRASA